MATRTIVSPESTEVQTSSTRGELYVGSMSGTAADGLDLALLRTDGTSIMQMYGGSYTPYPPALQGRILQAMQSIEVGDMLLLAKDIAIFNAKGIAKLLQQHGIAASDITAIGFHGQTIRHAPQQQVTLQIGNPALLATLTGIDVVCDFRNQDLAAGGQGAPLVPVFHAALAAMDGHKNICFLNIGGISNITYIGPNDELLAYDVGPGNAGMDDVMRHERGAQYDEGGAVAHKGRVHTTALQALILQLPNSQNKRPSIDRNQFDYSGLDGMATEDKLATMAEFTAQSIARGIKQLPKVPDSIIVCGGGTKNTHLLSRIQALLPASRVIKADMAGFDADLMEAYAFAYLAARYLKRLPTSFPSTTGVPTPQCGGALYLH